MDSINNAITNGQTNGVVVSGPATVGVVPAGTVVNQGIFYCCPFNIFNKFSQLLIFIEYRV